MVNINQLLKKAQEMQEKMQVEQDKIASTEFVGKSGGGLVSVVILGNFKVKSISIDPSIVDKDEKEMLEDLVTAAFSDAYEKASSESQSAMSGMLSGMPMPPGFKMPF